MAIREGIAYERPTVTVPFLATCIAVDSDGGLQAEGHEGQLLQADKDVQYQPWGYHSRPPDGVEMLILELEDGRLASVGVNTVRPSLAVGEIEILDSSGHYLKLGDSKVLLRRSNNTRVELQDSKAYLKTSDGTGLGVNAASVSNTLQGKVYLGAMAGDALLKGTTYSTALMIYLGAISAALTAEQSAINAAIGGWTCADAIVLANIRLTEIAAELTALGIMMGGSATWVSINHKLDA